jgi:integrase/recombinase XerD
MTHLRQCMKEGLRMRSFSQLTIRDYTYTVAEFAKYFHKSPDQLGPDNIRTFPLAQRMEAGLGNHSGSPVGAEFLYTRTLKQTWFDQEIFKPKVRRKLPTV